MMESELKPVCCGCGGEARVQRVRTLKSYVLVVMCTKCEIATNYYTNEAEAVAVWNRAMGAKDINVPNKFATDTNVGDKERTAKVDAGHKSVITGKLMDGHCMQCGRYVMDEDDYCPGCGARLEWE